MRVHENIKLILLGNAKYFDCEVNPLIIVDPGSFMFDGFPCENISYGVVAPFAEACEMGVRIIEAKRTTDKGDIIGVKEMVGYIGGYIRGFGVFSLACDVYSAKRYLSVLSIFEHLAIDPETERTHCAVMLHYRMLTATVRHREIQWRLADGC